VYLILYKLEHVIMASMTSLSSDAALDDAATREVNRLGVLTTAQLRFFYTNGYVIARGVIPPDMIAPAVIHLHKPVSERGIVDRLVDRAINGPRRSATQAAGDDDVGDGGSGGGGGGGLRARGREKAAAKQKAGPQVSTASVVLNLYSRTVAKSLVECVAGRGQLHTPRVVQLASIPPNEEMATSRARRSIATTLGNIGVAMGLTARLNAWHIDGVRIPQAAIDPPRKFNFTCLCGVYLSDIDSDWAGNFSVFPGRCYRAPSIGSANLYSPSLCFQTLTLYPHLTCPGAHHLVEQYVRKHGAAKVRDEGIHAPEINGELPAND
jgi:hypothetical protein